MQTSLEPTKTNNIVHTITCKASGNDLVIKIRLNDECKNGHADFAITGTLWKGGKPKTDPYMISGGCIHDIILKARPGLKLFVDLHLSDSNGVPTFAIANGFHHLKNSPANIAQEFIRATGKDMKEIMKAESETHFAFILMKLDFPNRWKKEAETATKMLEDMTGQSFVDDSVKSNWHDPSPEDMKEIEGRLNSGYYSPEKKAQRETEAAEAKKEALIAKVKKERDKLIKKARVECNVKLAVIAAGLGLDNFIYYDHTNEGVFNWLSYGKPITADQFKLFTDSLDVSALPKGIVFKMK